MGLFSSMFSSNSASNSKAAAQEPEEVRELPFLSELTIGMPLDVSLPRGKNLISGRLSAFDSEKLTLERKPGQIAFNVYEPGTEVYIRGFDDGAMAFDLKGVVRESSRVKFVVEKLEEVACADQRADFRIVLNVPALLYSENDTKFKNPEQCLLVDISATGACFQSEYIHAEGETYYLKIPFGDYFTVEQGVPEVVLGQIIRSEQPVAGRFRYGFLFAQLDERETNALVRQLFQIQMGNKRNRIQ